MQWPVCVMQRILEALSFLVPQLWRVRWKRKRGVSEDGITKLVSPRLCAYLPFLPLPESIQKLSQPVPFLPLFLQVTPLVWSQSHQLQLTLEEPSVLLVSPMKSFLPA